MPMRWTSLTAQTERAGGSAPVRKQFGNMPGAAIAAGCFRSRLLAQLMIEHDLSQKDIPEIGPQLLVSAVLSGKRKLNLRQAKALAKRFSVPMEVFTD